MNKLILALDPGRDKLGVAVMDEELKVYIRKIVAVEQLESYLSGLLHKYEIDRIVLGNGTTSEAIRKRLIAKLKVSIPIQLVDESYTTIEAEKRYRKENPPRGWRKLFSFVNWKPDIPVDDYVAVILAERYFKKND